MRLSTIAVALVAVSGPTIAGPIEGRATHQPWSITKFSFCKGESTYKYSFDIHGLASGHTPEFFGSCIGTNRDVFLECTADPVKDFNLFAKTEESDGVPTLTVMTWYVDTTTDCKYTRKGSDTVSDATCASKGGSKFTIDPKGSKLCN